MVLHRIDPFIFNITLYKVIWLELSKHVVILYMLSTRKSDRGESRTSTKLFRLERVDIQTSVEHTTNSLVLIFVYGIIRLIVHGTRIGCSLLLLVIFVCLFS